jgi:hypothetical protein
MPVKSNSRLAKVVNAIRPIGNIMAGDWERKAPWRKKQKKGSSATGF